MLHAAFLDTLPGWPHANNPSAIAVLLLLVGLPVAVAAVITVIGMGGRWRRGTADDAYAPDVRRSMARVENDSRWSDPEAGAENDEAPALTGEPGETHRGEAQTTGVRASDVPAREVASGGATAVARRALDD